MSISHPWLYEIHSNQTTCLRQRSYVGYLPGNALQGNLLEYLKQFCTLSNHLLIYVSISLHSHVHFVATKNKQKKSPRWIYTVCVFPPTSWTVAAQQWKVSNPTPVSVLMCSFSKRDGRDDGSLSLNHCWYSIRMADCWYRCPFTSMYFKYLGYMH